MNADYGGAWAGERAWSSSAATSRRRGAIDAHVTHAVLLSPFMFSAETASSGVRCDEAQRKLLNQQMAQHAEAHITERRALQATIQSALASGDSLVVRIDYTTSAFLPHFVRPPKVRIFEHV